MSGWFGESSKGGNSSSGWFGDESPPRKRRKKKDKRKKHAWDRPLAIADRWLEGAEEAVVGIPTLAKILGDAWVERAGELSHGQFGSHVDTHRSPGEKPNLDEVGYELGKGLWKYYSDFLGPTLPGGKEQGKWRKTLRYAEKHPFDASMDALIPFGGIGLAGKGAKLASVSKLVSEGSVAERALARLAALEKVDAPGSVLGQERLRLRGGVVSKDGTRAFQPKTLTVPTSAAKDVSTEVARNPAYRHAQAALLKLGSKEKLRGLPGIGSDKRLGRQTFRVSDQELASDLLSSERDFKKIETSMRGGLSDHEKAAWHIRATGQIPEKAAAASATRFEKAVARAETPQHQAEYAAMARVANEAKLKNLGPAAANRFLVAQKKAAIEHFDSVQDAAQNGIKDAKLALRTADDAEAVKIQRRIDKLAAQAKSAQLSRRAAAALPVQKDYYLRRLSEVLRTRALAKPGNREVGSVLTKARALELAHPEVKRLVDEPSKKMLRYEAEARKLEVDSTRRLIEEGVEPRVERVALEALESSPEAFAKTPEQAAADAAQYDDIIKKIAEEGREANVPEMQQLGRLAEPFSREAIESFRNSGGLMGSTPYVVPHFMRVLEKSSAADMAQYRKAVASLAEIGVVGNARLNRAWLHDMGLTMLDPRNMRKAHTNIVLWQHRKRALAKLLDMVVTPGHERFPGTVTDYNPSKWVDVRNDAKFKRYAESVKQFVDEDAPVIAGDAAKGELDELRTMLESGLMQKFNGEGPVLVPKAVYKELEHEFKNAEGSIAKAFDAATNGWRYFALNLSGGRWVANNIIGQFMLMAATYGIIRSAYNLLLVAGDAAKAAATGRGSIFSDIGHTAPQIETSGFAHTEMFGSKSTNRAVRVVKAPGNAVGIINGFLSDDIPRRTAFWIEVKPSVRRLIASGEAKDTRHALELILADPKTNHRITDKVIKSLVDFRDLSPFEKKWMRRAIPFYSWIKGSTVRTATLIGEKPVKAFVAAKGSEYAVRENEDQYGGPLPGFLKGQIIVDGNKGKNVRALTTTGLNPFVTPVDTAKQLASPFKKGTSYGTDNLLASVNPWLKTPLESYMNRDLFYGGKIDYTDESRPFERFGKRGIQQFPQWMTWTKYQRAKNPPEGTNPVYEPSLPDVWWQLAGLPIKTVRRKEAVRRGREEKKGVKQPWL